ncbi:transcriptional regulator [Marinobacter sp. R17]|uniref:ArsR/SmtB family transcription factor n=1 Tax=Marinobacter TaxID=2742 RepID=UPI000F4C1950|nr:MULTISPECIES: metalloregulator ArsR/SmtB family transcription factor [Marinobacter]ROT99700.1 transcriptional regulator [Marinobacter sp. R17]
MSEPAIDIHEMRASADRASQFLRSIANADRLMLLCQLSQGELGVSDLEAATGIRQPSLSQQLGILRREGLIAPRKLGKQVFYRIDDPKVLVMVQQLYDLFCTEETV